MKYWNLYVDRYSFTPSLGKNKQSKAMAPENALKKVTLLGDHFCNSREMIEKSAFRQLKRHYQFSFQSSSLFSAHEI